MQPKSERSGKFLFLLLIVGTICSFLSFLGSIIHAINEDFYFTYIEWVDSSVGMFNFGLGILTAVLFLFWIYHVHSDFRQISADYPVTPGGALRRILIPIYNIVGLWSVYSSMARFMVRMDDKTMMYGQQLMGLIPFYYFGQMIFNGLNRMMINSEEVSMSLELWTVGLEVFVSLMYISMFVVITNGLRAAMEHTFSEALLKMYLATMDVLRKWTGRVQNWGQILLQLFVFFEERVQPFIRYRGKASFPKRLSFSPLIYWLNEFTQN